MWKEWPLTHFQNYRGQRGNWRGVRLWPRSPGEKLHLESAPWEECWISSSFDSSAVY
ncbi:unnamed protein product [Linum tenue]|uniref:Uncharacterized protein n=1 Tax=Linum tenue TaxID=586396 RepID=A0AAV0ITQ7_9ROSI|nr:unnamed protein product [Linum tenue]